MVEHTPYLSIAIEIAAGDLHAALLPLEPVMGRLYRLAVARGLVAGKAYSVEQLCHKDAVVFRQMLHRETPHG